MGENQRRQIVMSAGEIARFLDEQRVATLATVGSSGQPHLVAMWYAVLDGVLWFETKAKSQKAVNLRRDGRATVMIETGHTYDALRGVAMEGHATIVDDPDALWAVGVGVWERYNGPYSEEVRPMVEFMLAKRVAVRFDAERIRSWDHRKLGLPALEVAGSTAAHL
ncbi:pyridoxamine 5'-phosphate oxidase family protein [Amycolatopsis magusensis]|uniref:pyridoxamine 5'-phosphate oxidase family protein n=1 Tax=Amycolatopsis magusensis TaxID=882444 RepID=UPI0037B1BB7F